MQLPCIIYYILSGYLFRPGLANNSEKIGSVIHLDHIQIKIPLQLGDEILVLLEAEATLQKAYQYPNGRQGNRDQ